MKRGPLIAGLAVLAAPLQVGAEPPAQPGDQIVILKMRPGPVDLIVVGSIASTQFAPISVPAGVTAAVGFYTYTVRVSKVVSGRERRGLITVHAVSDPAIRSDLTLVFRLSRTRTGDYNLVSVADQTWPAHRRRPRG